MAPVVIYSRIDRASQWCWAGVVRRLAGTLAANREEMQQWRMDWRDWITDRRMGLDWRVNIQPFGRLHHKTQPDSSGMGRLEAGAIGRGDKQPSLILPPQLSIRHRYPNPLPAS